MILTFIMLLLGIALTVVGIFLITNYNHQISDLSVILSLSSGIVLIGLSFMITILYKARQPNNNVKQNSLLSLENQDVQS